MALRQHTARLDAARQPRAPRLPRLIDVRPGSDLWGIVQALADARLCGVVCSDGMGAEEAQALARGLWMHRPPSVRRPLHPLLRQGARVHTLRVGSYRDKDRVVGAVAGLAREHGLRRAAVLLLEQALDEMLLNALYDAPVDGAGCPRYLHLPLAERLHVEAPAAEQALVRCAGDGERYVVSVRDPFGTLRRPTILAYLERCERAHREKHDPTLLRPGGAGVGLYLIARAATELLFRLQRGRLSEVVYAISSKGPPRPLRALLINDDG